MGRKKRNAGAQSQTALKPNIIFNTIPKSGSVYITKTLQKSLNYNAEIISSGYFPHDDININKFKTFLTSGGSITQEHLDASEFNIQCLKMYTTGIIIHFRDPRAVLLSWTHHMNKLHADGRYHLLKYVTPTPPSEYYHWEFE